MYESSFTPFILNSIMGFKKPIRNPGIYLSQKDMTDFFHLPEKEVKHLIEKRILIPKSCDVKILYRFTELMRASIYFDDSDKG
jgi:hypothetical protein